MQLRPLNAKRPASLAQAEGLPKRLKLARHPAITTASAVGQLHHSLRAPKTVRRARNTRALRVSTRAQEGISPTTRNIIQSTIGGTYNDRSAIGNADGLPIGAESTAAEALVADELAVFAHMRPELAASDITEVDIADYSLRFRIDDFRPSHGGVFTPRTQPEAPGSLKSDMCRALDSVRTGTGHSTTSPDGIFSALASGGYANAQSPNVLVYALSRHYPVKRTVLAHLDAPDRETVRALCAGEKYGYRVSLAQLELSYFGNPETRRWDEPESPATPSEPMADVRAIQARLRAFRELDGQRVFATDAAMLLTEASVLNDNPFWDMFPDEQVSHLSTKTGPGAYYDIEYKFLRTAVVLWPTVEQGNVMLSHCGAQSLIQHTGLIAALHPLALSMLDSDMVEPIVDDALDILEAPDSAWRKMRRRGGGKEVLADMVLRIAACRGMQAAWKRAVEACPRAALASLTSEDSPSGRASHFSIYRPRIAVAR